MHELSSDFRLDWLEPVDEERMEDLEIMEVANEEDMKKRSLDEKDEKKKKLKT